MTTKNGKSSSKPYVGRRTGQVIDVVARKNSDGFENISDYFPNSENSKRSVHQSKVISESSGPKPYIGRRTGKVINIVARVDDDGFENLTDYFPDTDSEDEQPQRLSQPVTSKHVSSKGTGTADCDQLNHHAGNSKTNIDDKENTSDGDSESSPDSAFGSTKDEVDAVENYGNQVDGDDCASNNDHDYGDDTDVGDDTDIGDKADVGNNADIGGNVNAGDDVENVDGGVDDDGNVTNEDNNSQIPVKKAHLASTKSFMADASVMEPPEDSDNEDIIIPPKRLTFSMVLSPGEEKKEEKLCKELLVQNDHDEDEGETRPVVVKKSTSKSQKSVSKKGTAKEQRKRVVIETDETETNSESEEIMLTLKKKKSLKSQLDSADNIATSLPSTKTTSTRKSKIPVRKKRPPVLTYPTKKKTTGKVQQSNVTSVNNSPENIPSEESLSDNGLSESKDVPKGKRLRAKASTGKKPATRSSAKKAQAENKLSEEDPHENEPTENELQSKGFTSKIPRAKPSMRNRPQEKASTRKNPSRNKPRENFSPENIPSDHDSLVNVPTSKITRGRASTRNKRAEIASTRNSPQEKASTRKKTYSHNRRENSSPEIIPSEHGSSDNVSSSKNTRGKTSTKKNQPVILSRRKSLPVKSRMGKTPVEKVRGRKSNVEQISQKKSNVSQKDKNTVERESRHVGFSGSVCEIVSSPMSVTEVGDMSEEMSEHSIERPKAATRKVTSRIATPGKLLLGKKNTVGRKRSVEQKKSELDEISENVDDDYGEEKGTMSNDEEASSSQEASVSEDTSTEEEAPTMSNRERTGVTSATSVKKTATKSKLSYNTSEKITINKDLIEHQESGLRRSQRHRVPPLQYWKNERIQYDRRKSGWVIQDVILNPSPKAQPRKRKNLTKIAPTRRKKGAKLDRSLHNESDDNENMELDKDGVPDDFEEEINPFGTVINPDTMEEIKMKIIHSNRMVNLQAGLQNEDNAEDPESAPMLVEKCFSHGHFGAGQLVLRPGAQKGRQHVRGDTMVFYIFKGRVLASIHNESFVLAKGSTFFVPEGNVYNIKNLDNKRDAGLFFAQIKG